MSCPRCGIGQLPNTLFCDICGQEMGEGVELPGAGAAGDTLRCQFLDSDVFINLPTRPELIFGRSDRRTNTIPDVDLNAVGGLDGGVSRRHARLSHRQKEIYLEDLGSLNGTYVNGERLPPHQRIPVRPGDMVRLGLLRLTFTYGEES